MGDGDTDDRSSGVAGFRKPSQNKDIIVRVVCGARDDVRMVASTSQIGWFMFGSNDSDSDAAPSMSTLFRVVICSP